MNMLALDPSKKSFGWAVLNNGRRIASGAESFSKMNDCADLSIAVEKWLTNLIDQYDISDLVIEMPHMRGSSTYILFGLVWTAHSVARRKGVRRKEIRSSELKKFATGRGGAAKNEMLAAAEEKFGFRPCTHDEADALMAGAWASRA